MKKPLALLIMFALAFSGVAATVATQEWVNKFFARRQNQEYKPAEELPGVSTGEFTDPEQPGVTFELVAVVGTEEAFRVVDSTIEGIPSGTYYAKTAEGSWKNVHISVAPEFLVDKIPYNGTNDLGASVVKYYDFLHTANNEYVSIISDGVMRIYKSGDKSIMFRVNPTEITTDFKAYLLGE